MDIQFEKNRIIERIGLIEDEELVEMIKNLLDNGLKHQTERISVEQYSLEIEAADEDIDRGNGISHEVLKERMKKW